MNNWPHQDALNEFYGDPRSMNGSTASKRWEQTNLVRIATPWALYTPWNGPAQVKSIQIHKNCAESLSRIFQEIWEAADKQQSVITEWGMHLFGGSYNFRLTRGGSRLSTHSWACAVDFDPDRNGFGQKKPNFGHIPFVLNAFENEGWVWGGNWSKPDGMHWQAARVR